MSDGEDLLEATRKGDVEKVEKLLNEGVDKNVKDENDNTPLHLAAESNYV